jgi:hypothetical protein
MCILLIMGSIPLKAITLVQTLELITSVSARCVSDRGRSGAHPASCTVGTCGHFPGGKARPGRDADHSPKSSAEVVNE